MKLVKEHIILEKFTNDNSDPIKDMGIGMITFDTIKRGDIIKIKDIEEAQNSVGFEYGVVEEVHRMAFYTNVLMLKVIPFSYMCTGVLNARKLCLTTDMPITHYGSTRREFLISTWKKYFDIIQPRDLKQFESVNEKFTEDGDPIRDMGIGSRELIKKWLEKYNIRNYIINDDLTIDVHHSVDLGKRKLHNFPEYIQFNNITNGYFEIEYNHFTTLRGCPKVVHGFFSCCHNKLTNLDYISKKITGTLNCENNKIRKIKRLPKGVISEADFRNNAKKFKIDEIKTLLLKDKNFDEYSTEIIV